ncbi:two-component system sensor histidine kinase NtrB [Stratiformator vulcanicus]|uniref:histidine kinase n=1 Tax=Stratiformator vulcanicus TaxID=2527980 RepID=A0A517R3C8_9PLAN|nr:ATP-binding protein [Stratiformator vulcanicus]QDT38374.1 Sensor protein ZraS [Stratiformator vulcanicus]
MFRVHTEETGKFYWLAVIGLLLMSAAALGVTIWVMVDFLREQEIVDELIRKLPDDATKSAEVLAGELRWQFRLSMLVVLNLVVTGFAVVLLWRAYRSSQESLRDIKALAGDILSSMDQAVITTDADGNVTSINRRGLELVGPQEECVGHPLSMLSDKLPLDDFRTQWQVEKNVAMTRDFTIDGNGSERTLRAFCQTLSDHEDNEIGNVLQLRDITERLLIEDRMRRMERYMGLGTLAVGLHHEIKNPLAALSLHVQLLEEEIDGGNTSNETWHMLGVIKTEVSRIGGVLEGFRDFASIDRLNLGPVDLQELIKRQVELVRPTALQHQVTLDTQIPVDDLPTIFADQVRLEQVLLNLLLNALDAMPDGGSVMIKPFHSGEIAGIEVTDSGSGIPTSLHDKVFDAYFTTKGSGTGLGLAMCDKIMRQHDGSLAFRSSSKGTTFEMTLPIRPTNTDQSE